MRKAFVKAIPKRDEKAQVADLIAWGLADKDIYVDGRGAESLSACIGSFRGRPGELIIAADLRVFGESRKGILDTAALLGRLKITVGDIHSGETSLPMLLDDALSQLAAHARFNGSKKTAAITGRRGGKAKAVAAALLRNGIAVDWLLVNIANAEDIPWDRKVALLNGKVSEATLRRHFFGK